MYPYYSTAQIQTVIYLFPWSDRRGWGMVAILQRLYYTLDGWYVKLSLYTRGSSQISRKNKSCSSDPPVPESSIECIPHTQTRSAHWTPYTFSSRHMGRTSCMQRQFIQDINHLRQRTIACVVTVAPETMTRTWKEGLLPIWCVLYHNEAHIEML